MAGATSAASSWGGGSGRQSSSRGKRLERGRTLFLALGGDFLSHCRPRHGERGGGEASVRRRRRKSEPAPSRWGAIRAGALRAGRVVRTRRSQGGDRGRQGPQPTPGRSGFDAHTADACRPPPASSPPGKTSSLTRPAETSRGFPPRAPWSAAGTRRRWQPLFRTLPRTPSWAPPSGGSRGRRRGISMAARLETCGTPPAPR